MKIETTELHKQYWDGNVNKAIRYWFYLNRGIDIFNQFKYVFVFIFGIYYTLKLDNFIWFIGMTIVSLPIFIVMGYLQTHRIGKVNDWLSVKFSTHYGKYNFELMEDQLEVLKGIQDELKKHRHTNN